jgi:hypothetical protein
LRKNIWRVLVHKYLEFVDKTGSELFLEDENKLLLKMSKDDEYIKPLNSFKLKTLYSIPHYDLSGKIIILK